MKIETTPMDDLWIGIMTVSVLYLVLRTVKTLERISKKVDAMVDHIGAEVDSAVSRLSQEANRIVNNIDAFGCKENIFQHAQGIELQCYRGKNCLAFGLAPRTVKKKSSLQHQQQKPPVLPAGSAAPETITQNEETSAPRKEHQQQLLALQKCVERIVKYKYRWPFHLSNKQKCSRKAAAATKHEQLSLCTAAAH